MAKQEPPLSLLGVILYPMWNHMVEKRLLGGQSLQFGRFLTGAVYLYESGTMIGCLKRDHLDILARMIASPGREAELVAKSQSDAKQRLQEFGNQVTSIYHFVWSTELVKVGLRFPDFPDFERKSKPFYEKMPCDAALEFRLKNFIVEGIGFGSLYPDLAEKTWRKSHEAIDKDEWTLARTFGVDLPEAPAVVTFEQEMQNVNEMLAAYASEYYPELMGPLDLRLPREDRWEKTQTQTNTSATGTHCPKCGRGNTRSANYCKDCGTPLQRV